MRGAMAAFVRCSMCGCIYNAQGTSINGIPECCPNCGLHSSGHYKIVKPVLKPSPLAAKPIDDTEIVRCRDCKHYYEAENYHPSGNYVMRCCKYFDTYNDEVEPDGFCAWGERRNDA